MAGIKIPVEASLDAASAEQTLAELTQKFNELGSKIAGANKAKFVPVDKLTIDNVKQLQAGFESLLKVSGELRKRIAATGQNGVDFLSLNWQMLHPDSGARARQMLKAFNYVTGGHIDATQQQDAAPAERERRRGREVREREERAERAARQPQSPLGRVASAGLGAAGLGGVAEGVMGAGIAGGVGALAAIGISKLIGGARASVGGAEQEVIGYDTLKRTLGDVNVDFDTLRRSLRESARGLDMNFNEAMKLGQQFTRLSGITGEAGAKSVAEEVYVAGGFGRSFGVDPSQSVGFFGRERMYGVTKNTEDSRRLGLLIGEGIAKSGAFSKVEEVLHVLGAFTEQQTRMGMGAANVGGYMGMLTTLMGSGIPGTDATSAGMMLSRVNAAIAGGGNAGEAGQNFLFRAIGSRLGLDPLQSIYMREQGAFGTGAQAFGKGSLYDRFASVWGAGRAPGSASGSSATNLQLVMDQLARNYAGRPELMISAMQGLFGGSLSQSMALATAYKQYGAASLGGMSERLKRLGININDVSGTGQLRLAQIEAMKAPEAEKDKLAREAATKNQEETEGTRTRAAINGVERAMQKAASELLTPLNAIREATMYLAMERGGGGPAAIRAAVARADVEDNYRDQRAQAVQTYTSANDAYTKAWTAFHDKGPKMTPEQRTAAQDELRRLLNARNAAHEQLRNVETQHSRALSAADQMARGGGDSRWYEPVSKDAFLASAKQEGMTDEQTRLALAMFGQESSNGANNADSNQGAIGDMQMQPATFAQYADPGWDIRNPEHNRRAAMRYIKDLWGQAKGNPRAVAAGYYGGPKAIGPNGTVREYRDRKNPDAPTTIEYADQVVARMRGLPQTDAPSVSRAGALPETPLPGEAKREADAKRAEELRLHATVQLLDAKGLPAAAPVEMATGVKRPVPAGG